LSPKTEKREYSTDGFAPAIFPGGYRQRSRFTAALGMDFEPCATGNMTGPPPAEYPAAEQYCAKMVEKCQVVQKKIVINFYRLLRPTLAGLVNMAGRGEIEEVILANDPTI
jgi:hypothetical protein